MSAKPLGAAVLGLRMGRRYLEGFQRNPHTEVRALCDPDSELLAKMKAEHNVAVAEADFRRVIEREEIDIVAVASPDYFHAEQSVAALEAGKDVICEKPLTLSLEEARAIVEAVDRTGRKFMVGQVCRYAPGFRLAREMVARGEIGELYYVESEYAHSYEKARGVGDWRVDERREPFIGGGCHAVDLLRWIAGHPVEAFAYANHKCLTDWPVNDLTVALYRYPGEVVGKVMVSVGCIRPYTMRTCLYGTEGTIVCDNQSPEIQMSNLRNAPKGVLLKPEFARFPVNINNHNVAAEIDEFVDCLVNDTPVVTDVREGARTVAACVAAVTSAWSGRPEAVEDFR